MVRFIKNIGFTKSKYSNCIMNRRSSPVIILVLLICSSQLLAQFSKSDYELVKTTFTREFDKTIILDYLHSNNPNNVIAALLSISHSNDTSYIPEVLKLNFDTFGKYIAFTQGQIGRTEISINYLLKKITGTKRNQYQRECYQAFGKIAVSEDLKVLLENYDNLIPSQKSGFAAAVAYYFLSGKTNDDTRIAKILLEEISCNDPLRIFDGLFAVARKGGLLNTKEILPKVLNKCLTDNCSLSILQYVLACLRVIRYFPNDYALFKNLLNHEKWNVRCEAVRTCCYYNFQN